MCLEVVDLREVKANPVTTAIFMHQESIASTVDVLAHLASVQAAWTFVLWLPPLFCPCWVSEETPHHISHTKVPNLLLANTAAGQWCLPVITGTHPHALQLVFVPRHNANSVGQ